MNAAQEQTRSPSGPLGRWAGDAIAIALQIIVALGIMREHLAGTGLFLGNFDRLGYFLAARLNELDAIRREGEPGTWNDTLFMGFNSANLPGAMSPLSPMRLVTAFASRQEFYFWAGVCVAGLMALAGISAYICLRKFSLGRIAAGAGALLYLFSTHSMIRLAQTDTSSLLLAVLPAGAWLICCVRPGNVGWHMLGLAVLATLVFFSSTGPPTIYVIGLWTSLALFQWVRTRVKEHLLVCGLGVFCGLVIALPHLWGVAAELRGYVRDGGVGPSFEEVYGFFNVRPHEFLRAFDDGIFGRYPEEVARLGNNLNLSEGFQIYSGTFATLCVLAVLLRYRGEWFRLFKFRDGLFSLFAWVLVTVAAVILFKPVAELVFIVFLKANLIHARLSVIGTLAMAVLSALAIQECVDLAARHRARLWSASLALVAAGLIWLALQGLAGRPSTPAKLNLHRPWGESARVLLHSFAPSNSPLAAPSAVHAVRVAPRTIRLSWQQFGRPAKSFEISMGRADGPRTVIGHTGAWVYDIGDIDPQADYWFSLRSISGSEISPPSAPVLAEVFNAANLPDPSKEPPPIWVLTSRLVALLASIGVFALLVALGRPTNAWSVQVLVCLVLIQAVAEADQRWNRAENHTFPVPFEANNYFTAPPNVLRSDHPAAQADLERRLEPERFRTVFLPEPGQFYHFVAPHLASYWGIRTVEGYLSGVPARLAALPWPSGPVGFRTISFTSAAELPWELLGVLNVRQAIVADTPLYFDTPRGEPLASSQFAGSPEPRVIPNAAPVLPREFFAAHAIPAEAFTGKPLATGLTADAAMSSPRVEGLETERTWGTDGTIRAHYLGRRVSVEVTATDHSRFLVLNELYHPRWFAHSGTKELQVYPVNTVMRGVEVPPGATRVEFEFIPYSRFAGWWLFPVAGTVFALIGLRQLSRHTPVGAPLP